MLNKYVKVSSFIKTILAVVLVTGLVSCDKFDGDQTIPAYIHIEKINLLDNANLNEGSLSTKITDAWVYVDDEFIGAYELPATFPVLKKGVHTIKVLPGIKMNGISTTRIAYPFYTAIKLSKTLVEQETLKLDTLTTLYDNNTKFDLIEGFEVGTWFQKSTVNLGSDTTIIKTDLPGNVFEGIYSGLIALDSTMNFFEIETINKYVFPRVGSPVFLELDYKINNSLTIGLDAYYAGSPTQIPVMTLRPTTQWKKIYINFTPDVSNYSFADNFKVFLGQNKDAGVKNAVILLDNIKIVHFNTSK